MKGKKTGGRVKGTPNRVTGALRDRITLFLEENWTKLEADFETLEPLQRFQLFEKLLQYSLPKLQTISHDLELRKKLEALSEDELDSIIERMKAAHYDT
jgi:hypothetical protein